MNLVIIFQLTLAHLLTDFVFQSNKWIEKKNELVLRSIYFWIHILLSGLFTYFLLQQWVNWQIPLFIIVTHGIIDYSKIKIEKKNRKNGSALPIYFFIDQLFHLLVIIIAWLLIVKKFNQIIPFIHQFLAAQNNLIIITLIVFLIWPSGIAIGKFTEQFRKEFAATDSLNKAGKYIGIFERLLVFIFILNGQYSAIGLLIAGKSILRISSEKDIAGRKKTEYVLIGTLLSFTIAVITGLFAELIIKN